MLSKQIFLFFAGVILFSAGLWYLVSTAMHDEKTLKSRQSTTVFDSYNKPTLAVLDTSLGEVSIQFLKGKATTTVDNFVKLAESDFYKNTKFHRVIKDFMIQGGDPLTRKSDTLQYGTGGPGYVFDDEINDEPMVRGVVAMANAGPNTNGSQFFILTSDRPDLEGSYTAFAKVVDGMDVVDAISEVKRDERDMPLKPIFLRSVTVRQ